MRAESEGVLGARNPTREAAVNKKAVTETQPSPRSRRKLPPSPALTPTLGKLNLRRKATQAGHTYLLPTFILCACGRYRSSRICLLWHSVWRPNTAYACIWHWYAFVQFVLICTARALAFYRSKRSQTETVPRNWQKTAKTKYNDQGNRVPFHSNSSSTSSSTSSTTSTSSTNHCWK